ncbi:MAG: DUF4097 family beta strand repeat protein [Solirubrobacterales bacterium]|nr:DUF4097 family beta strand repeat protein [Solirubrobacterales bacterium]
MSTMRIVVLAALGLLALSGTAFALTEALRSERDMRTIVRHEIKRIVVRADAGDVEIRAGLTSDVVVDRHDAWLLDRPKVRQRTEGDTLHVDARCNGIGAILRCQTDLRIAAPPDVDVVVEGDAGDVDLRGLHGRLDVRTEAGDVRTERVEPVTLKASTGAGDVDLDVFGEPTRVEAVSDGGDVEVVVPYGAYRVDATTDAGDVTVAGLIRDDLAPQALVAMTDAGDVTVRAR